MKYRIENDLDTGPEDREAGHTWEVVHTQPWEAGRYLPAVARLCTEEDARRICRLLNAEGDIKVLILGAVVDSTVANIRNHMTGF